MRGRDVQTSSRWRRDRCDLPWHRQGGLRHSHNAWLNSAFVGKESDAVEKSVRSASLSGYRCSLGYIRRDYRTLSASAAFSNCQAAPFGTGIARLHACELMCAQTTE